MVFFILSNDMSVLSRIVSFIAVLCSDVCNVVCDVWKFDLLLVFN